MVIVELNTMNKYAIAIFYSDEDEGYIAVVPELLNYCPTNTNIFIRKQKMGSLFSTHHQYKSKLFDKL